MAKMTSRNKITKLQLSAKESASEAGMADAASDWTKAWQIIAQALKEMRAPNCDQNARAIVARLAGNDLLIVRSDKVKD
jgi:hypothetical protein